MKVMQINAVYGVGSTGVIVEDLHKIVFKELEVESIKFSIVEKSFIKLIKYMNI